MSDLHSFSVPLENHAARQFNQYLGEESQIIGGVLDSGEEKVHERISFLAKEKKKV